MLKNRYFSNLFDYSRSTKWLNLRVISFLSLEKLKIQLNVLAKLHNSDNFVRAKGFTIEDL